MNIRKEVLWAVGAFALYHLWTMKRDEEKRRLKDTSASEAAMAGTYKKGFAGNGAMGLSLGG
jgi:hypothetical protein